VEDYFYKYHYKMFPVAENGRLMGCVSTKEIKDIPQQQWPEHTVAEIASACSEDNRISPDADAVKAISVMNQSGNSRLMVVDGGRLQGIITLKDLLDFLAMKIDLEQ
jgi:predicted transcriptional regulator